MPVPGQLDAVGRRGAYHHNRGSVTDHHVDDHDHNYDHDHNDEHAGTDHHIQRRQLIRHPAEEYPA